MGFESIIDCCSSKYSSGNFVTHLRDSHQDSCPKCEVLFLLNSPDDIVKHVKSCKSRDSEEIIEASDGYVFLIQV